MNRRQIHLAFLGAYALLVPLSMVTGWIDSVRFIAALSIWALFESRLAALYADPKA